MKQGSKKITPKNHFTKLALILFCALFLYYLFFANKGIVFSDEGVYTYTAELISRGQIPYSNFFLEYPPLYFYLLAGLYKVFGVSVLAGRYLSLLFCLGIFAQALLLVNKFSLSSKKDTIITLFCIASFGYPLINIPILTWPSVLLTETIMILLLVLQQKFRWKILIGISMCLAVQIALKQNIAATELFFVNGILLISLQSTFYQRIKKLVSMNLIWISITACWVYFLFHQNNFEALREFVAFSMRLSTIYPFNYPSISMLLEPLGLVKLLPYYVPIIFLGAILYKYVKNPKEKSVLVLLLPLNGFFTTIYPVSEVLHVYPYFGLVLVSLYIFYKRFSKRFPILIYAVLTICILSGLYMIHFRGHYRYYAPYNLNTAPLNLPKSQGIYIEKTDAKNISAVFTFIQTHTKVTDPIFAYPFSPMQYFLFNRPNPSMYPIYTAGYLTIDEENKTIIAIKKLHTRLIITDGGFTPKRPLARWILSQKKLTSYGQYTIYSVIK